VARRARSAATLFLGGALLGAGPARALDLTGRVEPAYENSSTSSTDATGREATTHASSWTQRYTLNAEERLFPLFRLLGYGYYESISSLASADGVPVETESRRWTLTGRAQVGDPLLNANLGYDRTLRSEDSLTGGFSTLGADLVRETWSTVGSWRPESLPSLNLQLSRSNLFDSRRSSIDQTTSEAAATSAYQRGGLEMRYRLYWQNPVDHLRDTDTVNFANGGRISYGDRVLRDRVSLYGSYELVRRTSDTRVTGAGGTVATQQFPIAGLSAVEAFPATPDKVALSPNGVLADGDTAGGAGLNLGFGPSLSGDEAFRDMGVQFADAVTPVNAVWIWVDRPLAGAVAGAITFTAYRSDDNLNWTQVPLAGLVAFAPFNNRFEIPIAETQARYLKVVAKPLAAAVTTDARYRDILVTEMQVYRIVSAESARGRTSNLRGDANLSVRVRLLDSVPLHYDFAGLLNHDSARARSFYTATNGLSLSTPLSRLVTLDARLERSDFDAGQGRENQSRASASLGAQPLATLGANLTYTGQIHEAAVGREVTNNLVLFGRAEPYRGVSVSASGGYTLSTLADGARGRQGTAQAGVSLTPNRWMVLSSSYGYSEGRSTGGAKGNVSDVQSRLEGTLTFNPVPAIFGSAGLARVTSNGTHYTLGNAAASVSPFPGGDLFLGFAYNETLDTRADQRVRGWGPTMRWKIRGASYLDAGYTALDSTSPAQDVHSRVFNARLSLALP
jgi:hypothetical protein